MTQTKIIKRADGSINTAHYMNRSRQIRSQEAHNMFKGLGTLIGAAWRAVFNSTRPVDPSLQDACQNSKVEYSVLKSTKGPQNHERKAQFWPAE